jgi:hypothetical protein
MRSGDDDGSAAAEFVLVGALLTVLTLSVMQFGLALHVRNTVIDAAGEGARVAALADNGLADGVRRTTDLLAVALGDAYAGDVTAAYGDFLGHPAASVTVRAPLPLLGLLGPDRMLEVTGHGAVETLD